MLLALVNSCHEPHSESATRSVPQSPALAPKCRLAISGLTCLELDSPGRAIITELLHKCIPCGTMMLLILDQRSGADLALDSNHIDVTFIPSGSGAEVSVLNSFHHSAEYLPLATLTTWTAPEISGTGH